MEDVNGLRAGRHRGAWGRLRVVVAMLLLLMSMAGLPTSTLGQDTESSGATSEDDTGPAFPTTLAEADLEVLTYSGSEWLEEFDDGSDANNAFIEGTRTLLESVGSDVEAMTVKSALTEPSEGNQAVILALRIDGVEAREFVIDAVRLLLGDLDDPEFTLRPLGDRWVLRVSDAAVPGVYRRTVYLHDDTAWIMGADEQYIDELLEQLPAQAYVASTDADVIAEELPVVLDGRRRTGLYEAREPVFLPALSERLGPAFETWIMDLYLDVGTTPTDIVGAIAWWGIESAEESIEVEGYQVPGATADVVERFLQEVFLLSGEKLPDEVSRTERELGGRQVTTVDVGFAKQHIFASGDTVWVVTDHVDEPAMAEEAIAALP